MTAGTRAAAAPSWPSCLLAQQQQQRKYPQLHENLSWGGKVDPKDGGVKTKPKQSLPRVMPLDAPSWFSAPLCARPAAASSLFKGA